MATRRWISTSDGNFTVATNWSGGAVPTSGDTVIFARNAVDLDGGLGQSAVTNITMIVEQSFTGRIGTIDSYLQLGCATVEIGRDDAGLNPPGSARINLDVGTNSSIITIINTGGIPSDDGYQCVRLLAASASTQIRARRGRVSLASLIGETATIDDIQWGDDAGTDTINNVCEIGSGVTMDDLNIMGGVAKVRCAVDAVNVYGGRMETEGTGTIGTLRVRGGSVWSNSTGTITGATVSNNGTLDLSRSAAARTITTLTMADAARVITHPNVTLTNGIAPSTDRPLVITSKGA